MYSSFENKNQNRLKLEKHPKLPFVYNYGNKQICIDHPKHLMNRGAMRQHVEGKAHNRNYDNGEPIKNPGLPKKLQDQIDLLQKKSKKESKTSNFDEIKKQVESIFGDTDDTREILARHVDDIIRPDVQKKMQIKKEIRSFELLWKIAKITSENQDANKIDQFQLGYFVGNLDLNKPKKPEKTVFYPDFGHKNDLSYYQRQKNFRVSS